MYNNLSLKFTSILKYILGAGYHITQYMNISMKSLYLYFLHIYPNTLG